MLHTSDSTLFGQGILESLLDHLPVHDLPDIGQIKRLGTFVVVVPGVLPDVDGCVMKDIPSSGVMLWGPTVFWL